MFETTLRCLRCGAIEEPTPQSYLCRQCGVGVDPTDAGVLDVQYDYAAARKRLFTGRRLVDNGHADQFRFLPLLPLDERGPVPPVGSTPLYEAQALAASVGVRTLLLKDETRNPTRAHKDRATAVGISRARAQGFEDIVCASSGNAAISMAGFAAFAGMRSHAFVPNAASEVRLKWLRRYGADVQRSEGNYDVAFEEAEHSRERGWYSRNCAYNPFLVEGKKTLGLEIAEQLGWEAPDLIVCPVGDACTLAAIGKAFRELAEMGVVDRLPRLIGIQAAAMQPAVERLRARRGEATAEPAHDAQTAAASINVVYPRNLLRLLLELDEVGGTLLAVEEDETAAAQLELADHAGLIAEFTSATTLAGLRKLAAQESLDGKTAVLVITGGRPDDM
jgi:threonine synthase